MHMSAKYALLYCIPIAIRSISCDFLLYILIQHSRVACTVETGSYWGASLCTVVLFLYR